MKIFLDCSDVELIASAYETGLIDGVTTNPSLMMKAGEDPVHVIKEIASIFPWNSSISAEVCLLYTSPSPRDGLLSRMPSSA